MSRVGKDLLIDQKKSGSVHAGGRGFWSSRWKSVPSGRFSYLLNWQFVLLYFII